MAIPTDTASVLGVEIIPLPVFDKGPQTPPCVIDDPVRGRVTLLSGGDEHFRAHFVMKTGQIRGQAYHGAGNVVFDILEGSCVFMTSDQNGENVEVSQVNAPALIRVPPFRAHVFIPLTDGVVIETADIGTERFLGNVVRLNEKFAPHVAQARTDIDAGKYRLYANLGLPNDLKS